jgi:glycosyltransferase involved in cell wall biosynthesis
LKAILSEQTTVHVLNTAERDACREFGISNPIEIIPNGVPRAAYSTMRDPEIARATWPWLRNRRVMLFMGRVWREKGLDVLLRAWHQSRATNQAADWILVIAGPDYRNYAQELEREVRALRLEDCVFYIGPVESPLKQSLLAASECFVLPSRSEGMSMAILEAMASGLPVAYSPECNVPELAESGGGWEVAANGESLTELLKVIFVRQREELIRMGEKGRQLGLRKYTLEQSLCKLVKLYRRLASGEASEPLT